MLKNISLHSSPRCTLEEPSLLDTQKDRDSAGSPGPLAISMWLLSSGDLQALEPGDVIRLHALLALGLLVGDLGAFIEALEAVTRYTAVVHENVLATLIRGDEAVAFLIVEPLYRSLGHTWSPPFFIGAPPQQKSRSSC